jgi:hypothetical protein
MAACTPAGGAALIVREAAARRSKAAIHLRMAVV